MDVAEWTHSKYYPHDPPVEAARRRRARLRSSKRKFLRSDIPAKDEVVGRGSRTYERYASWARVRWVQALPRCAARLASRSPCGT